jgi:hypothetical protein
MSIPDVEGVRDDVEYGVSNLDMSGFKLQKEDVTVELWRRGTQGTWSITQQQQSITTTTSDWMCLIGQ